MLKHVAQDYNRKFNERIFEFLPKEPWGPMRPTEQINLNVHQKSIRILFLNDQAYVKNSFLRVGSTMAPFSHDNSGYPV